MFICSQVFAQVGFVDLNHRDYSQKTEIDKCKYRITYTYKFIRDTIKKQPFFDQQVLEIGYQYSHYYSIFADKLDSVDYEFSQPRKKTRQNKDGSDGYNSYKEAGLNRNDYASYEDYWFDYPEKGKLTVSSVFCATTYIYEEPVSTFEWIFYPDTTTILGYKCMKATTTFRGRTYDVWFTPFLPIRQGMWKFNGLPGLILNASDTKGYFEWTATGIEKNINKSIYNYTHNGNGFQYVQRKDVQKLNEKKWKDPVGLYISLGINLTIKGYEGRTKPGIIQLPYIPQLELE
jgi:GLPGLI family protein